jgi:hypothetical protein
MTSFVICTLQRISNLVLVVVVAIGLSSGDGRDMLKSCGNKKWIHSFYWEIREGREDLEKLGIDGKMRA